MNALYQRLAADPAWMCQAKINGCRALWDGAELRTRNGQWLDAPAELAAVSERIDGEYLGGVFYAFDLVDHAGTLDERWAALLALGIQTIPAWVSWRDVARERWEGVVFKRRDSVYPRAQKKTTSDWIKFRA
jgi:ATP-dependent DNA ligase